MTEQHFLAQITRSGRTAANHHGLAAAADREVWNSAAVALRERAYQTDAGAVRVRVAWPPHTDEPSVRLPLEVIDERERGDARDLPAFVELFFHEIFLLFNIAVPGSFGGAIAASGGDYRVNEIALDARIFETAWIAAARDGGPATLPLAEVVAWYDSLGIGTQQIATTGPARTLFHLLHLARGAEDEVMTIARLAGTDVTSPVIHPMHDGVLDPRVDATDWTEAADLAATAAVAGLQARVREGG